MPVPAKPLLLDSSILLGSLLKGDPLSTDATMILKAVESGKLKAACSIISLQEVGFVLKREKRERKEIAGCLRVLASIPNLNWLALTLPVFERAIDWMPRYNLALSDSLLAASVLEYNLAGIITNDADFKKLAFVSVLSPAEALKRH